MARHTNPRVPIALARCGGNRTKAALLLDRWARTVRGLDPGLADELVLAARALVRRELSVVPAGSKRTYPPWRARELRSGR